MQASKQVEGHSETTFACICANVKADFCLLGLLGMVIGPSVNIVKAHNILTLTMTHRCADRASNEVAGFRS